jgi:hypothetical protein
VLHVALPSVLHEIFIALFSHSGELARRVVAPQLRLPITAQFVQSVSADLSQLAPVQYLADHVLAFYGRAPTNPLEAKRPDLVIILESQLDEAAFKNYSWPSYLANAAAHFRCEVYLLVLTEDPAVARWARGPFGPPQMPLRPAVFCLSEMPRDLPLDKALENPALAVLHALAHPGSETARIAFSAIEGFPEQLKALSFAAIMKALPDACREILEDEMLVNSNWDEAIMETEYMQRLFDRYSRVRVERATREAVERERLSWSQGLAFELMRSKQIEASAAEEAGLLLADEATLKTLIVDLGLATDSEQLRAAVARALASAGPG